MADVTPVQVPRESVSDDTCLVTAIVATNGSETKKGSVIAILETSKAAFDVESPADGFIFWNCKEGDRVPVGEAMCVISVSSDRPHAAASPAPVERARPESEAKGTEPSGTRFSQPALELLRRHGLSPDLFVGRAMVTRADVEVEINASAACSPQLDRTQAPEGPRVVLLGGGGHAKMCIDILRQMSGFEIIGILDAKYPCEPVLGVPFIADDSDEDLARLRKQAPFAVNAVGAVRNHADRQGHYARLKKAGFFIPNLIHPKAIVEPSVVLGEGNQIMAGAVVGSAARIGNNSIVNSGAVVSHDCSIGDNVHLAPGAILAGGVRVGSGTLVGMGVTVYLGVRIGQGVTINNGLDVHADVHDHAVVKRD